MNERAVRGPKRSVDSPVHRSVPGCDFTFCAHVLDGTRATFELHGSLEPPGCAALRQALERLIADGVTEMVIDLDDIAICTSHGVDVLADAAEVLEGRGGSVHLLRAHGVTKKVLDIIDEADPSFKAIVHEDAD
jgi:anti-anti-sigma regulatory factor